MLLLRLALVVIAVAVIGILVYRKRHKERAGEFVLGAELAAARDAEARRLSEGSAGPSPMPPGRYDPYLPAHGLTRPEAQPLEAEIAGVVSAYAEADPDQRAATRWSLDMDDLYTLIHFAQRSAVFALREGDGARCEAGWNALAMIDVERVDWRDLLVATGVLDHASRVLQGEQHAMLARAAELACPATAEQLRAFAERAPDDRTLEAWGFAEIETEEGRGLVSTHFEDYHPTRDLAAIGLAVSDRIATGRYRSSGIDIATDLPAVWFGPETDRVQAALARTLGTVSVSAQPRPEECAQAEMQHCVVFVTEAASTEDAELLAASAVGALDGGGAAVAVHAGPILAVCVCRPFMQGAEPFETVESVTELAAGLRTVLQ